MAHLRLEDKNFFKENGYLIKRGVLSDAQVQAARDALWDGFLGCVDNFDNKDMKRELFRIAAGKRDGSPFPEKAIEATRDHLLEVLKARGCPRERGP